MKRKINSILFSLNKIVVLLLFLLNLKLAVAQSAADSIVFKPDTDILRNTASAPCLWGDKHYIYFDSQDNPHFRIVPKFENAHYTAWYDEENKDTAMDVYIKNGERYGVFKRWYRNNKIEEKAQYTNGVLKASKNYYYASNEKIMLGVLIEVDDIDTIMFAYGTILNQNRTELGNGTATNPNGFYTKVNLQPEETLYCNIKGNATVHFLTGEELKKSNRAPDNMNLYGKEKQLNSKDIKAIVSYDSNLGKKRMDTIIAAENTDYALSKISDTPVFVPNTNVTKQYKCLWGNRHFMKLERPDIKEYYFKEGLKDGIYIAFYDKDFKDTAMMATIQNGEMNGILKEWDKTGGKLSEIAQYKNGLLDGYREFFIYPSDGKKYVMIDYYKNDVCIKHIKDFDGNGE